MTLPEFLPALPPAADEPGALPAMMLTVADHAERLEHHGQHLDDQDARLINLTGRVLAVEQLLEDDPDAAGYCPAPAPRWWLLPAAERADAVDRLAAWVCQVYAPSSGYLGRMLAACWREHDLCLFVLDFLSEQHSVLYLRHTRSVRTLADQAEFHLRILPAAAELMRSETARCDHSRLRGVVA
jgi:hypothetical protein